MLVQDIMTLDPVTVVPTASVKQALELLDLHRITSLPVVLTGGRLCGVVSEADLIRELVPHDPRAHLNRSFDHGRVHPATVGDVMTAHAVTVSPGTELTVAVDLLTSTTVKSVPVVDDQGCVRGVLSRADVVRCFARADAGLAQDVLDALGSVGLHDLGVEVCDGIVSLAGLDALGRGDSTLARVMVSSVPGVVEVRPPPADALP
ncbi:MAG: hypothetical protein JWN84_4503 [Nocardioides sp.]|jgi:CBS-domain-containing membrane protein|nr:hypothetical protein [Nocardioides sp.]